MSWSPTWTITCAITDFSESIVPVPVPADLKAGVLTTNIDLDDEETGTGPFSFKGGV